jgi:hypothetical protein
MNDSNSPRRHHGNTVEIAQSTRRSSSGQSRRGITLESLRHMENPADIPGFFHVDSAMAKRLNNKEGLR